MALLSALFDLSSPLSFWVFLLLAFYAFRLLRRLTAGPRSPFSGSNAIRKPVLSASTCCRFGAAEAQGLRPYMEDRCAAFGQKGASQARR